MIGPKVDEAVYFMLKGSFGREEEREGEDFLGIAVLNAGDVKVGKAPCEIDFYKNQEKLGSVNCLITKFLPMAFSKPIFHP